MSLLQPLGLLGLLGIPIIILIYLLKSKYVQKPVSSTFIWKRSLKYVKTRLPLNFIFSLLLILQLLTVIFASLAISRPTILPFKAKDTIIILDSSASMMTVNEDGKTRYQLALEKIEDEAGSAGENNKITVITAGNEAKTHVFRSADKVTVTSAIEELVCDDGAGDIDGALTLANNVQNMNPDTQIYFYTDKDYFDSDIEIVNFAAETDENIGITNLTDSLVGGKYVFNATVNYFTNNATNEDGTPVTRDVTISLHIDGQIVSTQTVTLNAGKNIVTFASKSSMAGEGAIFYQMNSISEYEKVKVTIDGLDEDGLATDDERTLYASESDKVKILVVSTYVQMVEDKENGKDEASGAKTTFLVTVLRNIGYSLSNKTDIKQSLDQVNNGGSIEGYDLYIFDGVMPEVLPNDGAVWFFNPPEDPVGTSLIVSSEKEVAEVGAPFYMIPAVDSDSETYKTLTRNIGKRNIAVGEYRALDTTDSSKYEEIFTCNNHSGDSHAVVMAGKENNVRIVCMSLDIHMTNLPMLIDFPLLINNMLTYSLPDVVEDRAFDVGEMVKFSAPVGSTEVELRYHDEKTGEVSVLDKMNANDAEFLLERIGVYSLLVKYENDDEKVFYLPASVPADEGDTTAMGDTIVALEVTTMIDEVQKDPMEAWPYVVMILLAIIVIEWGVYYRDEF